MKYLITLITPPGGTVLDCFGGSGTTAIACEELGFKWLLAEKVERRDVVVALGGGVIGDLVDAIREVCRDGDVLFYLEDLEAALIGIVEEA
jgi:hypothetical protein